MRRQRLGVAVASALLIVGVCAGSAWAGGSWLYPARDRYEPGETATVVGYSGGGQLGWIEDGPFYAYLRVDPSAEAVFPSPAASDLPLGALVLHQTEQDGYLNLRAAVTFALPPDLAPGEYYVAICNDPCTTGLGDFVGGMLSVGVDPLYPPPRGWPTDDPALAGAAASVGPPGSTLATPSPSYKAAQRGAEPNPDRQSPGGDQAAADKAVRPSSPSPPFQVVAVAAALAAALLAGAVLVLSGIGRRYRVG